MNDDFLSLPQNADPQLRRAAIFVSTGDFAKADAYCERVLDTAPENAAAYLLKAMAKCNVQKADQLAAVHGLSEMTEFKLARQFADPALAAKLDELLRKREAAEVTQSLRLMCAVRQEKLRDLLVRPELPVDLAAEVRSRIEAEQALMRSPSPEAAEHEAEASAALKDRIENSIEMLLPIRESCAVRQEMLRDLLERSNLPYDLAAEVRSRIEAEQALMRSPSPEAAEREAAATAALEDRVMEVINKPRGVSTGLVFLVIALIIFTFLIIFCRR